MVGTRPCRGRSGLAAATLALLVGLRCRRLGELLVVCSFFLVLSGGGLLDGFLAMADAGVELAAPAPRVEAVLLSSPPFLTLLTSTSLDAGLSSTELITCCAVEYVRGGVQGGVAFVTRPLGWSWSQP